MKTNDAVSREDEQINTRTPGPSSCFERINKRYVQPASFALCLDVLFRASPASRHPSFLSRIPTVLSCTRVSGVRTATGDSPFCRLYCQSTDANRASFRSSAAASAVSVHPSVVAEAVQGHRPTSAENTQLFSGHTGGRAVLRCPRCGVCRSSSTPSTRVRAAAAGPVVNRVRSRCIKCTSVA